MVLVRTRNRVAVPRVARYHPIQKPSQWIDNGATAERRNSARRSTIMPMADRCAISGELSARLVRVSHDHAPWLWLSRFVSLLRSHFMGVIPLNPAFVPRHRPLTHLRAPSTYSLAHPSYTVVSSQDAGPAPTR